MTYKSFNWGILFRLVIFSGFISALTTTIYQKNWISLPFFLVGFTISGWNLVYYLNATNRKITFFFDSVSNDDSTLHYSENVRNKSLRELHRSMNNLNSRISEIKLKSEHNERFYLEMLKFTATGLITVDEEGYVEVINNTALNLLGVPHIAHISLLQQKNLELHNLMMTVKPGQVKTIKVLYGTDLRLLSLRVSALSFGNKKYKLFSLQDIKTELEENELDSWQKLIRVMTHEIMNSIGPITSLSNILNNIYLKDGKPISVNEITEKQIANTIHGLDVIEQTGKGLMHFVEDYRKLTKIPKPVFKAFSIEQWLTALELLLKNRFEEEHIEFKIQYKQLQKEIIGDEKLLTQVLINLLNNSIDALKAKPKKKVTVVVTDSSTGRIKLSVIDNGAGIASEELEKIFIPFYTTKENGSGIGLSLSRQIMRLHKGSISAFSEPGVQTTVVLNF